MSRLREAEQAFARELKLAADLIDPELNAAHRRMLQETATRADRIDLAESLRERAARLEATPDERPHPHVLLWPGEE